MSDDISAAEFDIVVATAGRGSLADLLCALARDGGPRPGRVIVVDDRPRPDGPLLGGRPPGWLDGRLELTRSGGRGPAAARNTGWRRCASAWVAFLDDDVVPEPGWLRRIAADLAAAGPRTAAVQGRVTVPLPAGRRPTDWERNVHALEGARWITADMAVRREALAAAGGFDERFPRPYREDSDLALRLRRTGRDVARGERRVRHPVGAAPWWVSLRVQAGNRDDVLMDALHGPGWRAEGRRPRRLHAHLLTVAAAAVAVLAACLRLPGPALAAAALWLALTAQFAAVRIAPGPGDPGEVAAMLATSVLMPFVVAYHWAAAHAGLPRQLREAARRPAPPAPDPVTAATALEAAE